MKLLCVSRHLPIKQGEGASYTLSSLLYHCEGLLDKLKESGLGISIDVTYCGAPMYADDLTLIGTSENEL